MLALQCKRSGPQSFVRIMAAEPLLELGLKLVGNFPGCCALGPQDVHASSIRCVCFQWSPRVNRGWRHTLRDLHHIRIDIVRVGTRRDQPFPPTRAARCALLASLSTEPDSANICRSAPARHLRLPDVYSMKRRGSPSHQGTRRVFLNRSDSMMMGRCARRWNRTVTSRSVMATSAVISSRSRKIRRARASS
jgi:hypothetical protein